MMLDRMEGNAELKTSVHQMLASRRLTHSVLLVGEEGLGAGFAARCIAADYLYPAGGAPAEALLRGECCRAVGKAGKRDSGQIETGIVREAISVEGMGAGGRYLVSQVTAMRSEIFNTSLSAEGRAVLLYHVERMNEESANALLKVMEEPPEGVLFLLTADSLAGVLPTIRSRCVSFAIAPVSPADCARYCTAHGVDKKTAALYSELFDGHTCSVDDADDLALVKLGALKKEFVVEADANTFDIDIYANSAFHIERINQADWISLTCGETEDGKGAITAECEFNEGFKRKAGFVLCSDVDARRDTVYVKQKALVDAKIEFANSSVIVAGAGGENISPIETNIPFSEITVDIEYAKADNADWIESLEIVDSESENRSLAITTEANAADEIPRSATVSLSFTDGWEETVSVEFNLLQRTAKETLGRQITFEEFRQTYAMNKKVEDYVILEGIVVSNTKSHNAGENTQSTTAKIDYSISERTVYLETYDGKYGIAVQTATAEDNVFEQYDHVQILIQGASGYLVETPDRYELRNVTKAMVISRIAGSASDVPVKEKWMSQLTYDDIYTYVTLKDVEFPVRKGAITPINEGYAIGTGASRISKYPLLVRDINGDDMYMLTNTNCAYRSDGTRLPYGSGKISGVIVHERFSRFEWRDGADPAEMDDDPTLGFIGRYQIRHQTKGDIWDNMQNSVEDSFSALLTEYRYWNPDKENKVQKPTYGTNGYLTHTYQEKYTGSASKEYLQATFQQHMWGGGTYEYLGPVGNNASYIFGANFGNKNGIGVVIDPAKESWNPLMDDLVSRNPDGTLEWCGPYAKDKNAANGTGGWPGNNEIATNSTQINYNGSTGMRGKGNVYGSCYTAFANHFWWDDDTDRPYAWLINFSTEGITTSHISMQISVMNTQQSFFSPRFWCAEWSLTDSQAAKDDSQWNLIGEYTIPDVSVWANTLYSSCVAYKSIDFELPQEILGHENVYIRLRPTSDLCSDGSDYANARLNQSASGAALAAEHASSLEYFAIRYNK